MNSFISSPRLKFIMYFCTKIFGSNPAVAYFTNVSPFSVQSRIPIAGLSSGCITLRFEIVQIHIQLRSIPWRNLSILFHNNMTFQDAVIEYEVGKRKILINQDTFLPGFKAESCPISSRKCCRLSEWIAPSRFLLLRHARLI